MFLAGFRVPKIKKIPIKKRRLTFFSLGIAFIMGCACGFIRYESGPNYPQGFPIIERIGYTVCYDSRNKLPMWVYERLTQEALAKKVDRVGFSFKEDHALPNMQRSNNHDYEHSGFDRGHMGAATHHSSSEEALKETFYLTNICPQHPSFNRGLWRQLERHISDLLLQIRLIDVYTGPLFLPQILPDGNRYILYRVIGQNDVGVPTHFFKVLFIEFATGERACEAYILPNQASNFSQNISDFRVSLEQIERCAGILLPVKQLTTLLHE